MRCHHDGSAHSGWRPHVVPVEDTEQKDEQVLVHVQGGMGKHIRRRGEVVRAGEVVVAAGTRLRGEQIGILAGVGQGSVSVVRRPRVAVFSTGDELVPHTATPGPGKIRDSNRWTLTSHVNEFGGEVMVSRHLPDCEQTIRNAVNEASEADILVFSGGVSMGEFDFVDRTLRAVGVRQLFHKIAMKPWPVFVGVGKKMGVGASGTRWHSIDQSVFLRQVIHGLGPERGCDLPRRDALWTEPNPVRSTFIPARLNSVDGELVNFPTAGQMRLPARADGFLFRRAETQAEGQGNWQKSGWMVWQPGRMADEIRERECKPDCGRRTGSGCRQQRPDRSVPVKVLFPSGFALQRPTPTMQIRRISSPACVTTFMETRPWGLFSARGR